MPLGGGGCKSFLGGVRTPRKIRAWKDFLPAYIGDRIMVWLGGRIGERPDKLDFGCGS